MTEQLKPLTDAEITELLDWVSACQSSYHIDSTPGHRFGGLGSHLQENRDSLVEYVNALIAARAQPAQAVPVLTDDPLFVFAQEVIHGAYKPDEIADAAMRAIRHHSAVRAKMGVSQWLPIETAPKDGTTVLCWSAEFGARESRNITYTPGSPGHADGKTDRWWEWLEPKKNWAFNWSPTHWVPLPPPPGIVGEKGGA